jgi:hypothetical protein
VEYPQRESHGRPRTEYRLVGRIAVNKYLFARQIPDDSGVDAFNTVYEVTHLPYRKNNPDGSPTVKVSGWVKTTRGDHRLFSRG